MTRRTILLLSLLAFLVASCDDGAGRSTDAPTASATPSAQPSASASASSSGPSTTPTPAAVAYGPATLVTGEMDCTFELGEVTAAPGGILQERGGSVTCVVTTNDPRVSGHEVDVFDADRWTEGFANTLVQWGTARLRNGGGTWVGRYTGIYTDATEDIITYWYSGKGSYAGLSLYMAITQPPTGMTWPVTGLIFPGTPPPSSSPSTTSTAPAVAEGPTLVRGENTCDIDVPDVAADPDGTYRHRGGRGVCTLTTDDPRVSGREVFDFNADRWHENGADAILRWGSARLRNDGGTWLGRYTGMYTDATEDTITTWYQGTGGYAGLSLFVATIAPPSGSTWPEIGLIFPGTPPPR